ncbi:MAG: SPOR domain-containing protein [Desulfurivibrionaceae bacterium]
MSAASKKGRFVIRFELGLLGMLSLTLVTGCIFLWMFIIGIWAGQTILKPAPGEEKTSLAEIAGVLHPETAVIEPHASSEPKKDSPEQAPASESEWAAAEPSFFALQVSAVPDQDRAQQELAHWRERGYEAFLLPPEDKDDPFLRIYVGKFDKLAEANQLIVKLEKEEKVKAYIALLPASRLPAP